MFCFLLLCLWIVFLILYLIQIERNLILNDRVANKHEQKQSAYVVENNENKCQPVIIEESNIITNQSSDTITNQSSDVITNESSDTITNNEENKVWYNRLNMLVDMVYRTPLEVDKNEFDARIASYNLKHICETLNYLKIDYAVAFGTLIGFEREGDFLKHDHDLDLVCHIEDYYIISNILTTYLQYQGYKHLREWNSDEIYWYDDRNEALITFSRMDYAPLDIYFRKWMCNTKVKKITTKYTEFYTRYPENPDLFLSSVYRNWKVKDTTDNGHFSLKITPYISQNRLPFLESDYGKFSTTNYLPNDNITSVKMNNSFQLTDELKNIFNRYIELGHKLNFNIDKFLQYNNLIITIAEIIHKLETSPIAYRIVAIYNDNITVTGPIVYTKYKLINLNFDDENILCLEDTKNVYKTDIKMSKLEEHFL